MSYTKIVCTIGPASREPELLEKMIEAGMNVARLNLSHGTHEFHGENIRRIRAASEKAGVPVAIMGDLQGPKIRVDEMGPDGVLINSGETVTLTTRPVTGARVEGKAGSLAVIPVQYKDLPRDIEPDETILLDDGLMALKVSEIVDETDILAEVTDGGVLKSRKGLNLPGTNLSIPAITEKDWRDLDFMLAHELDWIALSFVRFPDEVIRLKEGIRERWQGGDRLPLVISKIEKPQALENIDEIIAASDGLMVARGDLGIEIAPEKVPLVQKNLIRACNIAEIPVIIATQMLNSMIDNPRPTRAEASDVANAILDGTDALMLSGETSVGKHPLEAVKTMARIATAVGASQMEDEWRPPEHVRGEQGDVTDAVSTSTCNAAHKLDARAIISATASGRTARAVASFRPHKPIIAVTPSPLVQRQLSLVWGVTPLLAAEGDTTEEIVQRSMNTALEAGLVAPGDRVVVTAGVTTRIPGATNLMLVDEVGSTRHLA